MPSRRLVLWLPAATVALVGWLLLWVARPLPVVGARLSGGPSDVGDLLSWRLELTQSYTDLRTPSALTPWRGQVRLSSGAVLWTSGMTDERGLSSIDLALPEASQGPVWVRLSHAQQTLMNHQFQLTRTDWQAAITRRGGWLPGKHEGPLQVEVALTRGVLAVPFEDDLRVRVGDGDGDGDGRGVVVELELDGARVVGRSRSSTDGAGECLFRVVPEQHSIDVSVIARGSETLQGRFNGQLPVVPGALLATLEGESSLRVTSPVPRARAHYSLTDGEQRLGGGSVQLHADEQGGAEGTTDLPVAVVRRLAAGAEIWAVVSSEADLNSAGRVGWPLRPRRTGEPSTTLSVPEIRLADSLEWMEAREAERRKRIAHWAAVLAVAGGLLTVGLLLWQMRGSRLRWQSEVRTALGPEADARAPGSVGSGAFSSGSGARSAVAIVCILIGSLAIAAFALWRDF